MAAVWSSVCALAAIAAGAQQAPGDPGPQMRTKELPGYGYIRYEVLPGDDDVPPGELIVVHEERRAPAPAPSEVKVAYEEPSRPAARRSGDTACSETRAKLLARLFEMQGMQIEPEFAAWLEKNLNTGNGTALPVQLVGGDSVLLNAMRADGPARALAEELARCEKAHPR